MLEDNMLKWYKRPYDRELYMRGRNLPDMESHWTEDARRLNKGELNKDEYFLDTKPLKYYNQVNYHMDLLELETDIDKMEQEDAKDILERGYRKVNKGLPGCRPEHRRDYDRVIIKLEGLKAVVRHQVEMKKLEDDYYK